MPSETKFANDKIFFFQIFLNYYDWYLLYYVQIITTNEFIQSLMHKKLLK